MSIYQVKWLRSIIIPVLRKLNPGTISIKHHYTKNRFSLDAFKHKGYWYHGKNRERETIELFENLIENGTTVIEVGGHIGYMSLLYSHLVGDTGSVIVFEPGTNNLPYLKKNIEQNERQNIELVEAAISNANGFTTFYLEELTGQNNSLLANYEHTKINSQNANVEANAIPIEVRTYQLDSYLLDKQVCPNFIKIDIEGAEHMALLGMQTTLSICKPMMMIEVTVENTKVFDLLTSYGYILFDEHRKPIAKNQEYWSNTFCLHVEKHAKYIKSYFN
jgi:FkbM family methyltransferase